MDSLCLPHWPFNCAMGVKDKQQRIKEEKKEKRRVLIFTKSPIPEGNIKAK